MSHKKSFQIKRQNLMMCVYTCMLFLMSVSVVFMPIVSDYQQAGRIPSILVGILFWTGFIGTIWTAIWINRCRKKDAHFAKGKQLGLVHFFQNKPASCVDIAMFISLCTLIVTMITIKQLIIIPFAFLAMFIFFFGMHCMLNGICFQYLNYKNRRDDES